MVHGLDRSILHENILREMARDNVKVLMKFGLAQATIGSICQDYFPELYPHPFRPER